ncbi:TonB-dependent receptor [Flavitalea flava]
MKLTAILMIASCLQVTAHGYSQNITIRQKKISLEKVFKEIERQSHYLFWYDKALIREAKKIDIEISNASVEEVLKVCFKDQDLTYRIVDHFIAVKRRDEEPVDPLTARLTADVVISGLVLSGNTGLPLSGASVRLKGSERGTATDGNGNFSLTVPERKGVLVISFVGFETVEIILSGNQPVKIVLKEKQTKIDEVVVVGYGTVKKSDLTGSVSTVSSEKITQVDGISNVAQALQGQAAGVQVNAASGQPGAPVIIKIRGTNSIGASNNPLYVVDGMPLDDLSSQLNPDDIASVQILKDASSTAIYGARGANGVILISTKKGKDGKTRVSYSGYFGVQTLRKKIKLLDAPEYATLQNEVASNDGKPLPWTPSQIDSLKGKGTDWQDLVYRPANVQSHDLSVSGGNENTKYFTSFNYYNQDGVIRNSNYTRFSFRGNLDQKINDKLGMATSLSVQHSRYFQANYSNADYGGVPFQTMVEPPTDQVYDANGNYTVFTGVPWGQTNPVGMAATLWNPKNSLRLIGNTAFTYEIINGLKLRSSVGIDNTWERDDSYTPPTNTFGYAPANPSATPPLPALNGFASAGYSNSLTFVNENTLSYTRKAGLHFIDAVGGITYQSSVYKNLNSGQAKGFISTIYQNNNIQAAVVPGIPGTGYSNNKLVSYIGRANYNYAGKYFVTFTGRYDGSSVFGENNKFAFFPSGALAWRISEEPFLKGNSSLSNLKLRASYGSSGSQAINPYQTLASLNNISVVVNNQLTTGYVLASLANNSLKWESTAQLDLGADLGLYNDRIQLTADYYNKKTSNLLLPVNLPGSSGFGQNQVLQNVGSVQNRGFEFQLTTRNITGVLSWSSVLTLSHNATKVLSLGDDATGKPLTYEEFGTGGNWFPLIVGQSMEQLYGYKVTGVYQSDDEAVKNGEPQKHAGDYKFQNFHPGSLVSADSDRVTLTHLEPKFTFGFNNTFSYKNFDLSLLFVGSYGNDIVNEFRKYNLTLNGLWNPTQQAYDNRWKGQGSSNTGDKPSAGSMQYTRDYANSLWVENGSYLRLRDITLGYTFSQKMLRTVKIASVRVYVSAQNFLTITRYSGYDPEASWTSATINGWDRGVSPSMKSVTGGLKVNF